MKNFAIRFYLVLIASVMLVIVFNWTSVLTNYQLPPNTFEPEKAGSTLVPQLLFPVLLVIAMVSHLRSRKTRTEKNGKE